MQNYYWDYDKYKFHLFIGDDGTRWDDEGVLQPVKLTLNGYHILNNNWGTEHNLELLLDQLRGDNGLHIGDNYRIETELNEIILPTGVYNDLPDLVLRGEDYKEFMEWIKSCLSTREERINIKLNKLLKNGKINRVSSPR